MDAGRSWRWTGGRWQAGDGREDVEAEDRVARVLRGGSWRGSQLSVRAASRANCLPPDSRNHIVGFRVVVRRPPSQNDH